MAAPSMTFNAAGNKLSATTVAASGTNSTTNLDYSARFEGQVQVSVTFGTVATTSGLQVDVYRRIGTGPVNDTIAMLSFTILSTASTLKQQSFALSTGRYNVKLTNLDATNSVTLVSITDDTVDGVA